jgi:hypothetical protein
VTGRQRTERSASPRGWLAALLLGLALWPVSPAHADHNIKNPVRCELTHLVLEGCPNLVKATFEDEQKHHWSFQVAGLIALYKKLEHYAEKPQSVLIVDYTTRSADYPRMLLAADAWFLYDAKGDESVSQKPHIYAFRTKDEALKAQQSLKGELLQWAAVQKKAKQLAADWEPTGHHHIELQGRPE